MSCNFVTCGGLQAVEPIKASPSISIENALSFEMATLSKPIFASLSAAFLPRQRAAGMPLFELARYAKTQFFLFATAPPPLPLLNSLSFPRLHLLLYI